MLVAYTSKMLYMRFVSYFTSRNALREMLILSRVDQRVTAKIIDFEVFSSSFLYQNSLFFASKILEKTTSKKQPIFHRFSHQNWSLNRAFWGLLGASWGLLAPLERLLGPLKRLLGATWAPLGRSWDALGASKRPQEAPKTPQEAPRGPKRRSRGPKRLQKGPQRVQK